MIKARCTFQLSKFVMILSKIITSFHDFDLYKSTKADSKKNVERLKEFIETLLDRKPAIEDFYYFEENLKSIIEPFRAALKVVTDPYYKSKIKTKLIEGCNKYLDVIEGILIESFQLGIHETMDEEDVQKAKVCTYKMRGDFHRYISECKTGESRTASATSAIEAYTIASQIASTTFPPTHSIRLGLANNFSVLYNNILNNPYRACSIASSALDDANAELHTLNEDSRKKYYNLLKDNLTSHCWSKTKKGGIRPLESC